MSSGPRDPDVSDYVRDNAPDLELRDVVAFMNEHDKPEDEKGLHVEWAVRRLRDRRDAERREGPPIDQVANEMRRHDASQS